MKALSKKDAIQKGWKCKVCYRLKRKYCECPEGNYRKKLGKKTCGEGDEQIDEQREEEIPSE